MYYSYGGANYYTPLAPQTQVLRPQTNLPPALPEGIAPQSVKLEFGGFQRVDDLSGRLEIEANRWCLDMHYNYRHNPAFAATYREAYQVLAAAKYVRSSGRPSDREEIRKVVAAAEPVFHQVQEKIKSWTREERRPVGEGGVNVKTEVVESILHHLLYDVGAKPQHEAIPEEQAPTPSEVTPASAVK